MNATAFVVAVICGDRHSLLREIISGLADQGHAKAAVVDSSARWNVGATLARSVAPSWA
jgi:hypothetical protein